MASTGEACASLRQTPALRSICEARAAAEPRTPSNAVQPPQQLAPPRLGTRLRPLICLAVLFAIWTGVLLSVRLSSAIKIGADEDYELSKALLYYRGFQFYTEVWNDQPLLHTAMVAAVLKHFGLSPLWPRLMTAAFSLLLLFSFATMTRRINGLLVAAVSTLFLSVSPGFVDLSASCMVEVPALAPALASVAILNALHGSRRASALLASGLLFGVSLQIKLINIILLPLVTLFIWLQHSGTADPTHSTRRRAIASVADLAFFFATAALTFAMISLLLPGGSYLLQIKQTWFAHFASARSYEYGSPNDFRFDWSILLKNWDQTLFAGFGAFVCLRDQSKSRWLVVPLAWLALELIVFGAHTPWWSYYYVHNAIPISWCAAIGFVEAVTSLRKNPSTPMLLVLALFVISAATWMTARVYFQVKAIRESPQTYNSLVLSELERFKPFSEFMYTDEGVYSFHSGIPLPPKLAVLSLKRFWSGDMTNEKLRAELWNVRPGLMLLKNEVNDLPYNDLLRDQYSLVYDDQRRRLYARKDILKKVTW